MNQISLFNPTGPQAPDVNLSTTRKSHSWHMGSDFQEILRQKTAQAKIRISNHCEKRLAQNDIRITPQQMEKLSQAADKAAAKGARESCIFMDDKAFIVSIGNRTLVTVVEGSRMKDSVFTNIDSAIFLKAGPH